LIGGLGNDTYVIDTVSDVVTEALGAGTDLVKVNVATAGGTYALAANVENAALINTVAFNLTGNALANTLTGNAAANILNGGAGIDQLTGGMGNDIFRFNTAPGAATNVDTITDFSKLAGNTDHIELSHAIFTQLTVLGQLDATAFCAGSTAVDSTDRIIYNQSNGALYYDADGSGAGAQVQLGVIGTTTHAALVASDFIVTA